MDKKPLQLKPGLPPAPSAACLLRLPHGRAPPLRHPADGPAPPAVPGEELQQRRQMWSATRPQASAGTSLDQAVLRLDAASHRVLRKGTSPRPSRPYVDNPTKPVSFNRVPTFSKSTTSPRFSRGFLLAATQRPPGLYTERPWRRTAGLAPVPSVAWITNEGTWRSTAPITP